MVALFRAYLHFSSVLASRDSVEFRVSEGKMRRREENGRICEGISGGVAATSDRVIIRAVRHGTEKGKVPARKAGDRANLLP